MPLAPTLRRATLALCFATMMLAACGDDATPASDDSTTERPEPALGAGSGANDPGSRPPAPAPAEPGEQPSVRGPAQPGTERAPSLTVERSADGSRVTIPAGSLRVGSMPGELGRRGEREADLVAMDIPAVDIDRALVRDPDTGRPMVSRTRAEAAGVCAERGRRLCHELEWERACRGAGVAAYATGDSLDPSACAAPDSCASPADVIELGVTHAEWTASDAGLAFGDGRGQAILRGSSAEDTTAHRCGARQSAAATTRDAGIAFRCCGGDAPSLSYPVEAEREVFAPVEVSTDRLREIAAGVPELAPYAESLSFFGQEARLSVFTRGDVDRSASGAYNLVAGMLAWTPVRGDTLWVFAGHSGPHRIVSALHPLEDGRFVSAATFVMRDDPVPVLLLFHRQRPASLKWTTCWGCRGEEGWVSRSARGAFQIALEVPEPGE